MNEWLRPIFEAEDYCVSMKIGIHPGYPYGACTGPFLNIVLLLITYYTTLNLRDIVVPYIHAVQSGDFRIGRR